MDFVPGFDLQVHGLGNGVAEVAVAGYTDVIRFSFEFGLGYKWCCELI